MLHYYPHYICTVSESNIKQSQKFPDSQLESGFINVTRITENQVLELSVLPVVCFQNMYYAFHQFMYRYLSKCQETKYDVIAVHTPTR